MKKSLDCGCRYDSRGGFGRGRGRGRGRDFSDRRSGSSWDDPQAGGFQQRRGGYNSASWDSRGDAPGSWDQSNRYQDLSMDAAQDELDFRTDDFQTDLDFSKEDGFALDPPAAGGASPGQAAGYMDAGSQQGGFMDAGAQQGGFMDAGAQQGGFMDAGAQQGGFMDFGDDLDFGGFMQDEPAAGGGDSWQGGYLQQQQPKAR